MIKAKSYKSIPIYFVGSILRQLVGFIMLPIYTSMLTPADYGVIGILVVTISVFETAIGARFIQAVPKFYFDRKTIRGKNAVVSTALTLTALISLISTFIIYSNSEFLSGFILGDIKYAEYLALYCMLLLTVSIEEYGLTYLRLHDRAILFVSISVAKLVLQLSLNIIFVVQLELGVEGVVYSALISSSVFALLSAVYVYVQVGFNIDYKLAIKLFAFSWPLWVAGIAILYTSTANRYFIRIFADLSEVGLFELASKFSLVVMVFVWSPFSNWWQTERFRIYNDTDKGKSTYPKVFNGVITVLVFAALLIAILCEPVIKIMASEEFHSASDGVTLLVIGSVAGSMSLFFNTAFLIKSKTIIISYLRFAFAALATVCFVVFIPEYGFIGASFSIALAQVIMFLVVYNYAKKHVDMGVSLRYPLKIITVAFLFLVCDYQFINDHQLMDEIIYKCALLVCAFISLFFVVITDKDAKILLGLVLSMFKR